MNFNKFSNPCTVIDVLSDDRDLAFIIMSVEVWTISLRIDVVTDALTTITVGDGVDILAASAGTDVSVDLRTGVSVKNVVSDVITALGVSMST